jgi:hypothetical protein
VDEIDETELLGALHSGRAVDGDLDGAKRAVSAAVLRSCCYEFRDQVDPRGLRLTNTVIAGELDLAGLTVPFPLRFHGCEFDSAPVLEGAELFELSLTSCPRLAAKVFRQHGYTREAEQILIAQRRHARQVGWSSATWPRRTLDAVYATIGYGYRPARVLWALAGLLILVAVTLGLRPAQATLRATNANGQVYTTAGPIAAPQNTGAQRVLARNSSRADACGDGAVRCFNPILYAIDTVIPLISLDQRSTWYPDSQVPGGEILLWLLNLATILGWLLSSIFVLSLARLSRST